MADQNNGVVNQPSTQQQQTNPLSRKLNKILETRLESDKELVEALKALSVFFNENTLRTRRNLRSYVERRSLATNEQFESQFRHVKEQLDAITADIKEMDCCCKEMTSRLQTSKDMTSDLIGKTTKLQHERKKVEMQAKIADAFLEKFQLKQEEIKVLRGSRGVNITEEFFKALARAKQIHQDCKLLLRSKQQRAGLEIMETMALYQETAYEKLYRWTQDECRGMTNDSPDITGALCRAMEALQDRPVLFKYTLDELGGARRSAVVRCFIDALTRGGPGGTPRPIELHSHDPIRYVGDMLGWLHQSIASEKELLHSLLRRTKPEADKESSMKEVLNHITEGVSRPFKVRVEQVITSEPDAPVLFKLGNLLKFYNALICPVLGGESIVIETLHEMSELCQRMFYNSLSSWGNKLSEKIELPPSDLGPSVSVQETLSLLREVLSSHDAAITSLEERQKDYDKILSVVLDPLLQACAVSASRLNSTDMATYMVNCLYQIQSTLSVFEFTDIKIEMLAGQIEAHSDTLLSEQASFILNRSGLGRVYSVIRDNPKDSGVVLSTLPGLDPGGIKAAMIEFDKYLANPDSLVMPQCHLIRSTRIRDTVYKKAIDLVCLAFNSVHSAISDPRNKYDSPQSLLLRSPDQVLTLLM
ncbi:conserved oligomeric Golgi complex subunit 6-like isoform X1 [Rhopilema esculentum]|uniref:conserved oligomeric Golgi complex subunit 6-like isoform X1 n=2 Tax=Rhopilema esculentum TaxID=499914 RepID=UPI0031D321C2